MPKEDGRYRVAILGNCCMHGEFVAAALKAEDRASLVGGFETDPRRAPALSAAIQSDLVSSGEALLDDPDIDIVALACSPHEKADWAERAIAAGKHVFLNKPFAESLESARRIERAVAGGNVQLVHDIGIHQAHPVSARFLDAVRSGAFGEVIDYHNAWGMTLSADFALGQHWPERLDPAASSGGGELTNLGCYAIDYMVALFGRPQAVQARTRGYWSVYAAANLENHGQIIADYGDFYAVLAAGKQPMPARSGEGVAEALDAANWHNVIDVQFEGHNVVLMPYAGVINYDGMALSEADWLAGYEHRTAFRDLTDAIETGVAPDSDATVAALGVEVLMAAYRSALEEGSRVALPLEDEANPLIGETGNCA